MVHRVEMFLTSGLITMQNLVAVSHTACAHMRKVLKLGDAGAPPPVGCGAWLTPSNTSLWDVGRCWP